MRYESRALSASLPLIQPLSDENVALSGRQNLRGLSYEEGVSRLSPSSEPRRTQADAPVQLASLTQGAEPARTQWAGRLTTAQEVSATYYNRSRGYNVQTIKRYQSAVRTLDDGAFGPNTAEAVARFQEEHGLDVDGKIGPQTQAAIEKEIGSVPESELTPTETTNTPPESSASSGDSEGLKSGQLSANFSLSEFASKDGAATPKHIVPALRELAEQLEALKAALGGAAIHITSGYRSPAHNRRVGGASRSQHVMGRACDIYVPGYSSWQVANKIEELIRVGKMKQGGIGRYNSFVHYDTRGYAARW